MAVNIGAANREAVDRLCRARPAWTRVATAREALGAHRPGAPARGAADHLGAHVRAHARRGHGGGPLRGLGADAPTTAQRLAASGDVAFGPCHSRGAVGPMAGVISPGTPLLVIEDPVNRTSACTFIADGPWGHQLRFGAHGPETLAGLAWIRDVVAPAFQAVLEREGPIDLASLMAQALAMGDEMHMRNAAATGLLARRLAAPLVGVVADREQLAGDHAAPHPRQRPVLPRVVDVRGQGGGPRRSTGSRAPPSSRTMARNGVEFGIRVAGLGDRWFTGPASVVDGLYFPGFTAADANLDTGDSAIMETYGLGGMAMAASPAVQKIVGAKSFADAVATSRHMAEICAGTQSALSARAARRRGHARPASTSGRWCAAASCRAINTAIAHRTAPRMIGAGIATPPSQPFVDALVAFGAAHPLTASALERSCRSAPRSGAPSTRTRWC